MRLRYFLLCLGLVLWSGTAAAQQQPRLIINEFLADPATDAPGDANGDGTRSSSEDEFVELANATDQPLDLTGWMVGDDEGVAFTFPDGYMLPARGLLVIFGGGDVTGVDGYDADPLQTRVFSADSTVGNGFANSGDYILVLSPDGTEDMYLAYNSKVGEGAPATDVTEGITFEFGVEVDALANEDVSVTRSPDGNLGENAWVQHDDVSTALFSPGTTVDGSPVLPKELPDLTIVINEVLADPSTDLALGDANGDGERSSSGDEFIELANVSDAAVDLSGWTLGDDEAPVTFTFPDGYTLEPNEFVVVFGGGDVSNVPGYDADPLQTHVFVVDSLHLGIGNGFANGGDFIFLLSADGSYDTYFGYGSKNGTAPEVDTVPEGVTFELELGTGALANADNAITRFPDGSTNTLDPFVQHLSVSDNPWSPGTTIDGKSKVPGPKPPITVVINEILATDAGDANGDGSADANDAFIELVNTSEDAIVDLGGFQVGDGSGATFTFPTGYLLQPQAFVAVFQGGDVTNAPGYDANPMQTRVFSAASGLGDGLQAGGDYAVLVSPDGAYDSYVGFGGVTGAPSIDDVDWEFELQTAADANQSASITRNPDGDFLAPDPFIVHSTVSELAFSPAQTTEGLDDLDDFVDVPHPWGEGYALQYSWWERDRVEVRDAPTLMPVRMEQGTVELWMKPDSLLTNDTHDPDWTYLISKNLGGNNPGDLGLGWRRGEGRLVFFMQDGENTVNLEQSDKIDEVFYPRWYHIAATWNTSGNMRLFIDGKLVAEAPSTLPLNGGDQVLAIGGGAADLFNERFESFRGMIDEVRFSVVERYTEDFELPTAPYEPDAFTLALWHFDEGTGETAADATGNGFTGYLGGTDLDGEPDPDSAPAWVDITTLTANDGFEEMPERFTLSANYPNPFNPATSFDFTVPRASDVEVSVYNVLGQQVAQLVNGTVAAGTYTVRFDASDLASGVYFYVLRAADTQQVRQMVLLK